MRLPKKITPCPIVEAIVEVRFQSEVPPDAIFGMVYPKFKEEYSNIEKLPILQVPEALRSIDPQLIHKPHYKLSKNNLVIQIGPRVIAISNVAEYIGWDLFSLEIMKIFNQIAKLNIFQSAERVGIRYINMFMEDIFDKIDLKISMKNNKLKTNSTVLRAEIESGDFTNILQIAYPTVIVRNDVPVACSVIDIDTVLDKNIELFSESIETILQDGHVKEKSLFFELLKTDFLNTLNPEY